MKQFNEEESDEDDEDDVAATFEEEEAVAIDDEDGDVDSDEDDEYEDYLAGSFKYGELLREDDELSDFEEDLTLRTPMDDIDPYVELASMIARFPPTGVISGILHNGITQEQQSALNSLLEIARTNAAEKAK
ncbi:hypothetical protein HDU96_000578 [Phlyctochytrium bullatum]|nr:hypothetical protein HDU96_000578 [Phlyctochytrium bullatum]